MEKFAIDTIYNFSEVDLDSDLLKAYKYIDWNNEYHRQILLRNEVYLSSPDQFNDPFEFDISFNFNEDLTPEQIIELASELVKDGIGQDVTKGEILLHDYYNRHDEAKEFISDGSYVKMLIDSLRSKMGVFSVSKLRDSISLWSYYGCSHRGVCIGFDTKKLFSSLNCAFAPVRYSENKTIPSFKGYADDKWQLALAMQISHTKSAIWGHEEELRFTSLHAAKSLIPLNEGAITEVIIGLNATETTKTEVVELCSNRDISVFQAKKIPGRYEIGYYKI